MKIQFIAVMLLAALCLFKNELLGQSVDSVSQSQVVTDSFPFKNWKVWNKMKMDNAYLANVKDTFYNNVSISIIPFISTNGRLSVNTVNRYSLNVFAGYSKGTEVMEIGGYVNIDNGNVQYLQLAGFTNVVTGTVTGSQYAGFVNVVGKDVLGLQGAGFTNVNGASFSGLQLSGFCNVNKQQTNGVQATGFVNVTGERLYGLQGSGFLNIVGKEVVGLQFAGFGNISKSIDGIQGAGFFNATVKKVNGIQVAGFLNSADTLDGLQFSGFLNRAKHVNGGQVGLVNVSRSCHGLPIGFLSYVHTGYHKIEVALDEQLLTTLAFRTGIDYFHNIFLAGSNFSGSNGLWTIGYGAGTAIKLKGKWYLNLDLTAQTLQKMETNQLTWNNNSLNKLYFGAEYRIGSKLSVAGGPTLNFWVADNNSVEFVDLSSMLPGGLFNSSVENASFRGWIGGKVAIRFL